MVEPYTDTDKGNAMTATNSIAATVGAGRSVHFAYYVNDKITGTYCDRAAWETKRVRPMHGMSADDVTCTRCLKVAASPDSVPNWTPEPVDPETVATYADPEHARRNFLHLAEKAGTEQARKFWQATADAI